MIYFLKLQLFTMHLFFLLDLDPVSPNQNERKVLKPRFKEHFLNPEIVEKPIQDEECVFNFGDAGSSDEEYLTDTTSSGHVSSDDTNGKEKLSLSF